VFACAEQQQGEEEGFGVLLRSAAAFGEGVLLAEAVGVGRDRLHREGGQGRFWAFSVLHHIQNT